MYGSSEKYSKLRHIYARTEQNVDVLRSGFLAERFAHFLAERFVPGVSHGRGGREARRGNARVEPQVIARRGLLSESVRTVGERQALDAELGYLYGRPKISARQHGGFLFETHFGDDVGMQTLFFDRIVVHGISYSPGILLNSKILYRTRPEM